ncbi:MAG: hypothetical protein EXQ77_04090 [Thermoleophilia bacterium]|nr:hypothetical protein [Thermoleophilia bacterium]
MKRPLLTLCALALVLPSLAFGKEPACPNIPLPDRLDATPVAFIGALVSHDGDIWHFDVQRPLKGAVGTVVDVRAAELVDANGTPLVPPVVVGVLALHDGADLVTDSCSLAEPNALVTAAEQDKGGLIKIVVGLVLLAGVLQWSSRRRRRGTRPDLPGAPSA